MKSEAAKKRWASTPPEQRREHVRPMVEASQAQRRRERALWDAFVAAGVHIKFPEQKEDR